MQRPGSALTRAASRLGLIAFGLALSLVVVETGLRIWTNPFGYRIRGDQIVLPIHAEYQIRNESNPKLDPQITHTKNSIGFRGPEPPADFEAYLSIIAVGGSTTEQFYISDGQTWAELLAKHLSDHFPALWINNAGFAGHSTFGHQILLDDVLSRIQPDLILYLVGANELGLMEIGPYDLAALGDPSTLDGLVRWMTLRSETAALVHNFTRTLQSRRLAYEGGSFDLTALPQNPVEPEEAQRILAGFRGEPLQAYRERLTRLVRASRSYQIEPVLVTQPALFGDVVDPTTGVDLGLVSFHGRNGAVEWMILELYNDVTRAVAQAEGVFLVDLAAAMPKDSQYYRDMVHYTNPGSEKVAGILYPMICRFISETVAVPEAPCEGIR